MQYIPFFGFLVLVLWGNPAQAFLGNSSSVITRELETIETELEHLPQIIPSIAPWTMGCCSKAMESATEPHEITVLFKETNMVDSIVLMPAARMDEANKLIPLGFPEKFYIERLVADGSTEIIADYRESIYPLQDVEPVHFFCPSPKPTIGIRLITVQATIATSKSGDPEPLVALGELYAFNGPRNIALNANVITSKKQRHIIHEWNPRYLVDGFSMFYPVDYHPYTQQEEYWAYSKNVIIHFDLGEEQLIDELRIWPGGEYSEFRLPYRSGKGCPTSALLERLAAPDDPAPETVFSTSKEMKVPGINPFIHRLPPVKGRYFRFTLKNGFTDFKARGASKIILSEIELLRHGRALSRDIIPTVEIIDPEDSRAWRSKNITLTNGRVKNGKILPLRQWLEQFSRRRALERKRTALKTRLEFALLQEKERTRVLIGAAGGIILILAMMLVIIRLLATRRWSKMREQIAADLHDEVGANLSSIVNANELIAELIPHPTEMQSELLDSAISTARETVRDTRQFIQFLEHRKTGLKADAQLKKIAAQILGPLDHSFSLNAPGAFDPFPPIQQWNLFFFLKEALNNVIKHANATHVEISTNRAGRHAQLIITDNGCGIPPNQRPPYHLKIRAKQLKGNLRIESLPESGTQITLTLKTGK